MSKDSRPCVRVRPKRRSATKAVGAQSDVSAITGFAADRAGIREAAKTLALGFQEAWPKALKAATGPIDVVDMFAGCGGMSAGFVAANAILPAYRLALAIDIDRLAMASYKANLDHGPLSVDLHRYARNQRGVAKMVREVRSAPNAPLVLIGCAPCQGFSSHRNTSGDGDERNSLFLTFARIAAAVGPDAIIVENVPEVVTDRYWPTVEAARKVLEDAEYQTILTAHDMAEFGVPQHRFRAVMIAMRRPFAMPEGFLFGSDQRTVREVIGSLPRILPGEICPADPMHYTAGHRASTVKTIRAVPVNGGRRPADVGPECLRRIAARQGREAYEDVYGRLWWDRPAITITGHARNPASGRYVHPEQHRGLSVREAALLQGFPASWTFAGGLGPSFLQLGNAVPPPFAAFLAIHILGEMFGPPLEALDRKVDISNSLGPSFSRLIPALKAGHRSLSGRIMAGAN
jgi:DNA (cytosine-5)-methyltransferase 1